MVSSSLLAKALNANCIVQSDDYNSWQESFWGRWKRRGLDKDIILAEGKSMSSFIEFAL